MSISFFCRNREELPTINLLMPFYYHHRYKGKKTPGFRTTGPFYLKWTALICSTGFVTCKWRRKKIPPSMAFQSVNSQTVKYGKYHTKTPWLNSENRLLHFFKLEKLDSSSLDSSSQGTLPSQTTTKILQL